MNWHCGVMMVTVLLALFVWAVNAVVAKANELVRREELRRLIGKDR